MTYLDHDPIVKALNEKDLFVKLPYLDKGGIKSHLLVWPSHSTFTSAFLNLICVGRWMKRTNSSMAY